MSQINVFDNIAFLWETVVTPSWKQNLDWSEANKEICWSAEIFLLKRGEVQEIGRSLVPNEMGFFGQQVALFRK